MGYYMSQQNAEFYIKADDVPQALTALQKWGANVNFDEMKNAKDFSEAMWIYGFQVEFDKNGNCTDILFEYDKLRGQDELLAVIAPYVAEGSFLQMIGEDDAMWRWVFRNGALGEISAKIVWE